MFLLAVNQITGLRSAPLIRESAGTADSRIRLDGYGPCRAGGDPPGEVPLPAVRRPEAVGRDGRRVHARCERRVRDARGQAGAEPVRPGRDYRLPAGEP